MRLRLLTPILVALALPAVARAQQEDNPVTRQLVARMSQVSQTLRDSGFTLMEGVGMAGALRARTFEEQSMRLEAGRTYLVVGVCDDDCNNIDLRAADPGGRETARDIESDPYPVLLFEALQTGDYQFRLDMIECSVEPCGYYVQPYVRGGGAPGRGGATAANARVERGRLEPGDPTLGEGEYYDVFTVQGTAGQVLVLDLESDDFDTYVFIRGPDDFADDNDDYEGSTSRSRLEVTLPATGAYRVVVTSYEGGETGAYTLTIGGATPAGGNKGDDPAPAGDPRLERGRLERGDQTLDGGEYIDMYTVEGRAGQDVVIDLRSAAFDTYLLMRGPGDFSEDNDDFEGSTRQSVIRATLPADGEYRIGVTSYAAAETGDYELRIEVGAAGQTAQSGTRRERGALADGDATLRSGEFADEFTFEGMPGQRVTLDLQGRGFDPYLILISPADEQEENDDWEGSTSHSRIATTLSESGQYRVLVTSYAVGETGDYDLDIAFDGAVATDGARDVQALAPGRALRGRLEAGDGTLEAGEYRDVYVFDGTTGQDVTIDMRSTAFDTYLALVLPDGETVQNDDHEGSTRHSRIALALQQAGRYRVVATSYAAGETGDYDLTLTVAAGRAPAPAVTARGGAGGPRIFGVFAGISQYGGRAGDLPYTAEDAVRVRDAMQRGAGMPVDHGVLLTDRDATAGNIRGAIERYAGQMGPDDMLVFFYSGHGGREPRRGAFQQSDPDNLDETLEFYDRGVTDDEFAGWLDLVTRGRVLLVLDACFSGGFAKDVISRPDRMGMFSSEEDVTSSVAAKFRAGGYLAVFLADAVADRLADADGDGTITALELSQYVHDRYRMDVKSGTDPGDYVRTGGPQLGYQHLVVDRGSVGPYDVLFR